MGFFAKGKGFYAFHLSHVLSVPTRSRESFQVELRVFNRHDEKHRTESNYTNILKDTPSILMISSICAFQPVLWVVWQEKVKLTTEDQPGSMAGLSTCLPLEVNKAQMFFQSGTV